MFFSLEYLENIICLIKIRKNRKSICQEHSRLINLYLTWEHSFAYYWKKVGAHVKIRIARKHGSLSWLPIRWVLGLKNPRILWGKSANFYVWKINYSKYWEFLMNYILFIQNFQIIDLGPFVGSCEVFKVSLTHLRNWSFQLFSRFCLINTQTILQTNIPTAKYICKYWMVNV